MKYRSIPSQYGLHDSFINFQEGEALLKLLCRLSVTWLTLCRVAVEAGLFVRFFVKGNKKLVFICFVYLLID